MSSINHTLRKRWSLWVVMGGMLLFFSILYALRMVLFPFVLGMALAYLLAPVISWVEDRLPGCGKWLASKRVAVILGVYILSMSIVVVASFFFISTVVRTFSYFMSNAEENVSIAIYQLQAWTEPVRQATPDGIRAQIDSWVTNLGSGLAVGINNAIIEGVKLIPSSMHVILGLATVPFFLFYVLKDREKLSDGFYSKLPSGAVEHVRNVIGILQDVLGRYVRATLTLGLVVGILDLIGLLIVGAPMAPMLALVGGLTEMVPIIGPWLGGGLAVLTTLALAPQKAALVAMVFLAVQLLENTLIVPKVQSSYMGINPALTIVLLVVGVYLAGFWGLLLTLPLTVTIVKVLEYVDNIVDTGESQRHATGTDE
ncbi:MAG: AI-2E family transporter [Chloroflexi bacterium]|nr:AI-2E family transporter [Chloroflexota bacterium]